MATISAALVKDLREKTGAGMMDCKTALGETGGDIEAAIDWLRKKGLAKAAKKSGRVAAEGLVGVAVEANLGVVAEVNSETDFVARNDDFQSLVHGVVAVALDKAPDIDAESVKGAHYPGGGTVADAIANAVATIGENITLRRAAGLHVPHGVIGHYVHSQIVDGLGRIGVIVALEVDRRGGAARGRSAAMWRCTSPRRARSPSIRPASTRRRSPARRRCWPTRTPASRRTCWRRSSNPASRPSTRRSACSISRMSTTPPSRSPRRSRRRRRGVGAPIAVKGFVRFALGEGVEKPAEEG